MKLLVISLLTFLSVSKAAAAPTVLITSFEPFLGSRTNNSMAVSDQLQQKLRAVGYNVETCLLPVVYDVAAKRALECYSKISPAPAIVLSLGEGSCDLRVEDLMLNYDSTPGAADNAGKIRNGEEIIPGAIKLVPLTPLASRLYCALDEQTRSTVVPSSFAGGFVCNNTGFRLGLQFRQLRIPYDFIHVPEHTCGTDPADTAQKIAAMVAGAWQKPSDSCVADYKTRAAANGK